MIFFNAKEVFKAGVFFALAVFVLGFAAEARGVVITQSRVVMGTKLDITLSLDDKDGVQAGIRAEEAFDAIEAEFKRIEQEMSEWIETSQVSFINRHAGNAGKKPTKVTDELFKVISAATTVSELTNGAFDVTWAAMHGLWDFRPGKERLPTQKELAAALPLIDFRQLELDQTDRSVYLKRRGMKIGLGGIAKGYAIDRASKVISDMGVSNFIIRAGGDMRVQGKREKGTPWDIGIRHPREKTGLLASLPLTNISISTSGDYERFFERGGVLYHHIIDPRTGYPARGSRSVTILAPDTMTSDALSTAVFVLGPKAGMELVNRLSGVEAIIVDPVGTILTSEGIDIGRAATSGSGNSGDPEE